MVPRPYFFFLFANLAAALPRLRALALLIACALPGLSPGPPFLGFSSSAHRSPPLVSLDASRAAPDAHPPEDIKTSFAAAALICHFHFGRVMYKYIINTIPWR